MFVKRFVYVSVIALAVSAQSAPTSPSPLLAFLGHWEGSGQFAQTKYSKPHTVTSTTDCAWTPQGTALVCQTMVHEFNGYHTQLSVDAPDNDSPGFSYYTISPGHKPFYGTLTINGKQWIYGPAPDMKGHYPEFRTTNEFSGDAETFKTEFTDDGTHWTTMLEGILHRTKQK
jgi:hypothetical protein